MDEHDEVSKSVPCLTMMILENETCSMDVADEIDLDGNDG